jgi:3-hydroxybutyryl-CoA dehydrogenase
VVVAEADEDRARAGRSRIASSLKRALAAGKLDAGAHDAALARCSVTTDLDALADCDLVVEAISEDPAAKLSLFAALDELVQPDAVLASNTSSIPIARLAAATSRPGAVLGIHFFNPAPVMGLVEIVPALRTDPEVVAACEAFVTKVLKKQTIRARDRAGFVVNALLVPYLLAAIRMLEAGHATAEAIDAGMELGCAHPMGPLALCDLIGLDTVQAIADALYEELRDPSVAAPPLLRRMVDAGLLGRKSGQGFYDHR